MVSKIFLFTVGYTNLKFLTPSLLMKVLFLYPHPIQHIKATYVIVVWGWARVWGKIHFKKNAAFFLKSIWSQFKSTY